VDCGGRAGVAESCRKLARRTDEPKYSTDQQTTTVQSLLIIRKPTSQGPSVLWDVGLRMIWSAVQSVQ
jgi:hypothetical protein